MNCLMRAWDSHEIELRAWLRHRLNNSHDAEDLLQDLCAQPRQDRRLAGRGGCCA
jgi:RNA polymerase sigma-70 factor (ECF subfamily)